MTPPAAPQPPPPEEQARRLVAGLESLLEGEGVVTALVALGQPAVPPLRRFLLEGRPATVYQPRRWAVQALAALGATAVLMEYLALPPPSDPQLRFAEDAVRNAAVLEFLRWPGPATEAFLLDLSRRAMLPSLVEVFGRLRTLEALPYLERALQDDFCRLPAEDALFALGEPARPALLLSAATPRPSPSAETPSSLRRRQSALRVLARLGAAPADWPALRPLTADEDHEIAVRACSFAVQLAAPGEFPAIAARLIELSALAPWDLLDDIAASLTVLFPHVRPAIELEITRRLQAPPAARLRDQTLRILLRVRRLAAS